MPVETGANFRVRRGERIFSGHDDKVERREVELPKRFSGQATQPVPVDGAGSDAARNRQSESSGRELIELRKHCKEAIG